MALEEKTSVKAIPVDIQAQLNDFMTDVKANLLQLHVSDNEVRKLIHIWSGKQGYISKTSYERDGISHVQCSHCFKWLSTAEQKREGAYCYWLNCDVDPKMMGAMPDDYDIWCTTCQETTYYSNDYDYAENVRYRWRKQGKMIIMKRMQAYKHLGSFSKR